MIKTINKLIAKKNLNIIDQFINNCYDNDQFAMNKVIWKNYILYNNITWHKLDCVKFPNGYLLKSKIFNIGYHDKWMTIHPNFGVSKKEIAKKYNLWLLD